MTADYDVRKTRMDASKQEILSVIEGEQAKLKVADAEPKTQGGRAKLKADRSSAATDNVSKHRSTTRRRSKYSWMSAGLASLPCAPA